MRRMLLRLSIVLATLLVVTLCVLRFGVLPRFDADVNRTLLSGPIAVPDEVRAFHDRAFVADLHADPLLWKRNLEKRHDHGHVDLPRLREGGVDLQVFGVVTKVPETMSYRQNRGDTDRLPLLFVASWRSPLTWFDPRARALAQARELRRLLARSGATLVLRRADLDRDGLKGLLALEGMHALRDGERDLERLHRAGFRMMGLAHFFDNAIAGSAHGVEKHGLTELGQALVPRLEALGVTLDLAHASPAAFDDALRLAKKPVVVSHTGVQGTCPGPRNLSDSQLRRLARNGGVAGIGYWSGAVCDTTTEAIVRAVRHAVRVAGVDHVGLGSDFDGNITAPFDTAGLPGLTRALLASGLDESSVEKIVGGNVRRVLEENLPE